MVSGCPGWAGPTVPAAVVESRSDIEVASLLSMEAKTVHISLDLPTSAWKLVRAGGCHLCSKCTIENKQSKQVFLYSPEPCPDDGCVNTSCPTGLVRYSCAPCLVSCAHISTRTTCRLPETPCSPGHSGHSWNMLCCKTNWWWLLLFYYKLLCFCSHSWCQCLPSGCWCPEGMVMNHMQQCVLPEECMCEVAGVRYWPGQEMKVDCEICVCERGRPQKCQPNPDCTGGSVQQKTLTECRDQFSDSHCRAWHCYVHFQERWWVTLYYMISIRTCLLFWQGFFR